MPFQKPRSMVSTWLEAQAAFSNQDADEHQSKKEPIEVKDEPSQAADYMHRTFILQSQAYQWLLSKVRQSGRLTFPDPSSTTRVGTRIRGWLRARHRLHKLSRSKPSPLIHMKLNIEWNPLLVIQPGFDFLNDVLCLTGSYADCQATTVEEYMGQTWPSTGGPILELLRGLVATPQGQEYLCTRRFLHPLIPPF